MSTFVSVGNAKQPFDRLLKAVKAVTGKLPPPITVQYGHNDFVDPRFNCVDFLKMETFQELVNSSDLLILHGGAGSVITALQAGKRPVVMARRPELGEHVDGHQIEFVTELEKTGKVTLAEDADSLAAAIEAVLGERNTGIGSEQQPSRLVKMVEDELLAISAAKS